jgi:hypothetical protein
MATDNGISDTCLYMMATSTDINGTTDHADPTFWLSPDVVMTNADNSFAKEGVPNTTNVTVRWKTECQDEGGGPAAVVFDLYVCTPSMNITTAVGSSVALATSTTVAGISSGGAVTTGVVWTPLSDSSKPNGQGHRCLIARCYPFGLTPDPLNLSKYVTGDQHYVQHNLTIDVLPSPHKRSVRIRTGNAGRERQLVTVNVIQDFEPKGAVLDAILPALHTVPEFKRIATTPIRHMAVDFSEFKGDGDWDEKLESFGHFIADSLTGLFGHKPQPNLTAKATLPPGRFADMRLNVDVSGSAVGDAHILHLTQTDSGGNIDGGITVAVVTA